jgi:type III secretion apparatus needle protein
MALGPTTTTVGGVTTTTNANLTVDNIYDAFAAAVVNAGNTLGTTLDAAAAAPNDPVNMIKMQKDLANYTLSLSVQSAVVKSIEETAKSVTQKL